MLTGAEVIIIIIIIIIISIISIIIIISFIIIINNNNIIVIIIISRPARASGQPGGQRARRPAGSRLAGLPSRLEDGR